MKLSAPLVKSLLMAASVGLVVPVLAQAPKPTVPSAKGAGEEEPAVVGVARPWAGGLLGLAVEGNAFVLRFYDAEKKPLPPAAARATARWDATNKAGIQRAVLNPSAPDSLRSPSVVRPPLTFSVFITLLDPEGNSVGTQSFDLKELK